MGLQPKYLRFADTRVDRYAEWPSFRKSGVSKVIAKRHSQLYKLLRKDARFAAPKLAAALERDGALVEYMPSIICRRPLHAHIAEMNWNTEWERVEGLSYWAQETTAAHSGLHSPARIACYPTRADAARGREVVMTPGKFYAAIHDSVPAHSVQIFAEKYLASKAPLQVHFIDNAKEGWDKESLECAWMETYRNPHGFTSCMSDFPTSSRHPARFYARPGNGLSLAYITHDGTPEGEVVARSIVNRERAVYVRCYGDARLARALEEYGMEASAWSALRGIKCNVLGGDDGNLVAPYLDGDMSIQWNGSSSFCTIVDEGEGNYNAQDTGGYATPAGSYTTCDECDETVDEEDITYSSHHDRNICDACRERNYTTAWVARREQSLVLDEDVIHINGVAYLDDSDVISSFGFNWSEHEQEWLSDNDSTYLEYRSDYVSDANVVKLDVDHGHDSHALEDDTKEIVLCGETLTVHEDYDGPEDADEDEESEAVSAQMAA